MTFFIVSWIVLGLAGSWGHYIYNDEIDGAVIFCYIVMAPIWGPLSLLQNIQFTRKFK